MEEVRAAYEALERVDGAELLEEPTEASWGGGFAWRDPEGNLWDVAWAKDATFDDRGGVLFAVNPVETSMLAILRGRFG